jgi:hypothetical protein
MQNIGILHKEKRKTNFTCSKLQHSSRYSGSVATPLHAVHDDITVQSSVTVAKYR